MWWSWNKPLVDEYIIISNWILMFGLEAKKIHKTVSKIIYAAGTEWKVHVKH